MKSITKFKGVPTPGWVEIAMNMLNVLKLPLVAYIKYFLDLKGERHRFIGGALKLYNGVKRIEQK